MSEKGHICIQVVHFLIIVMIRNFEANIILNNLLKPITSSDNFISNVLNIK